MERGLSLVILRFKKKAGVRLPLALLLLLQYLTIYMHVAFSAAGQPCKMQRRDDDPHRITTLSGSCVRARSSE